MARVTFAPHFRRYFASLPDQAAGGTVADVLDHAFVHVPGLRGYILDDSGRLRRHVRIFVDDEALGADPLSTSVTDSSHIYILQALSGG